MTMGSTTQTDEDSIPTTLPPMSPIDQCSTSNTSNTSESQVHARMDQLQNQLNQVLLMM